MYAYVYVVCVTLTSSHSGINTFIIINLLDLSILTYLLIRCSWPSPPLCMSDNIPILPTNLSSFTHFTCPHHHILLPSSLKYALIKNKYKPLKNLF